MERQTVTVEQAAQALGVGRNLAYELVRTGKLPSLRLGRRIVVPRAALDRLLAGDAPAAASQSQQLEPDAA